MLALRNILQPRLATAVIRPLAIRGLALRVNVRPPEHAPVSAAPGYDIKESMEDYQVDVKIPRGFNPEDLSVDVEPDKKHIHISGTHKDIDKETHFEEHFASGHELDVDHLETDIKFGQFHLKAPKAHKPLVPFIGEPRATEGHIPITAAPGYDVKESFDDLQIDMNIPQGFGPDDVAVEFEPDKKHLHVSATHDQLHFEKDFASGHALDIENVQKKISNGHLHLTAPKTRATTIPEEAPPKIIFSAINEDPVTVAPGYDIMESTDKFQVDMNIPRDFAPDEVQIEFGPNSKEMRVEGRHGNVHFFKRFSTGHALDTKNLSTNVSAGLLHVEVPKSHL